MLLIIQYLCYYYESLLTYGFSGTSMNIRYYIDSFAKVLLLCFTSKKRTSSCWFFSVWHTKKSVESDYCRSTDRGSRIAFLIKRQREAHAEYKHSPCYIVKVRVCAYAYTQKTYQYWHKRDNLYPVGHLSLLCSYQVEICEISISQNKAQ